jgi:hypothetical protein
VEFLDGEIQVVDGYVRVCNESVPNKRRAREILANVDLALEKSGLRAVLFDTRDMPAPPEEVNEILRYWVDAGRRHDKVALLVTSDLKRIASNMRALAVQVKLRSFHDLGEAEEWLRAPIPVQRPPSRPQPAARREREASKPSAETRGTTSRWRSPLLRGINSSDEP